MDTVPGFGELFSKVLSECGLISGVFFFLACAFAWQLAKTRAAWEADRANTEKLREGDRANAMKILADSNQAYDKLAVAHAELRGRFLTIQARGGSGGDE